MKLGYPCINQTIDCTTNRSFRLASYNPKKLLEYSASNLACLAKIIEYNSLNNLLFFRISSNIIPFAAHDICKLDWQADLNDTFKEIGAQIKRNNIRISMHPDQFILLNSPDISVTRRSIKELVYRTQLLNALDLDTTAKIQLHIGGMYKDKPEAIKRFINNYKYLDNSIKKRLVIENDDRIFSAKDCLSVYQEIGIPLVFDTLHHECLNNREKLDVLLPSLFATWSPFDGVPMVDYSSQDPEKRRGKHAATIDIPDFKEFIEQTKFYDFDIMLEIKDKEKSALKALDILKEFGKI